VVSDERHYLFLFGFGPVLVFRSIILWSCAGVKFIIGPIQLGFIFNSLAISLTRFGVTRSRLATMLVVSGTSGL
jgi:hypothetical protein